MRHVLRHARVSGPRASFAAGQRLEVSGCEDNASALNAEAHTDEHLELAVWDDHESTHDVPELDFQDDACPQPREACIRMVAPKECLACPKWLPTLAGMTGTSQPGFQIFDFHFKQALTTAHWKRFKIIRVKHTSDGNIAVFTNACLKHSSNWSSACARHKRTIETLFRWEQACAFSHKRTLC